MEETRIENGLVAFFDILGYQSFLENNDAEIATSKIIDIINESGMAVSSQMITNIETMTDADKEVLKSIQWLVFSDTILMLMKWDRASFREWMVFTAAAIKLCRHMFDFGLPLRGAIKTGSYLVSKSCFAGRAIVDAYRAETSLDLAACSVDGEIINIVQTLTIKESDYEEILNLFVVKYMTPLKDGHYKKMSLLNYLIPDNEELTLPDTDVQQLILNSFWEHNKDISSSAEYKAKNTANFFRYLKFKFPEIFSPHSAEQTVKPPR